jgi:hypothetical protein
LIFFFISVVAIPVPILHPRPECLLHLPVESFHQATGLWMIGCGQLVGYAQPLAEATPRKPIHNYTKISSLHNFANVNSH